MAFIRDKMWRYGLGIFFVLGLNFVIVQLLPGDPLVHLVGEEAYFQGQNPQEMTALRAKYGLDRPFHERFLSFITNTVRFRLGWSYHYGQPVARVMLYRLKWTLVLLCPALFVAAVLGLFLGCLSGRPGINAADRILTPLFLILYAVPAYCLAFLLLLAFASMGDLLPLGGMRDAARGTSLWDVLRHMVLPQTVLVLHITTYLYMIMRSTVRQTFRENYVMTALGKGLKPKRVLLHHVLLNALPPYVAALAVNFGFIAGGALLVEVVFSWQGMGSLMYGAAIARDYPILSGCFLVLSLSVIGANMVADILCAYMDPRLRDDVAVR
ncbi:MAG: ABC transporter permease [Deltaproteobacteria bacterium]|nr:ABC transporter permease [Deltaproteobacteria bacterium]